MNRQYMLAVLVISVGLLWFLFRDRDTHARMFCAYGKVFVEFEETGNIWGTIMLDQDGRPIPCRDEEDVDYTPSKSTAKFI